MRTQQEIVERFNEVDDPFGTQKTDLLEFMTFETAKPYLIDGYVNDVETGKEKWEMQTDPKIRILDYLPFAYEKAEDERGLSSMRSLYHFLTWVWLDDAEFYKVIKNSIMLSDPYGIKTLDKISEHYGYKRT